MTVRVYTVYSRILGIFRPATGHHAQREPLTALGDGDGWVVARGAGPEDGAAARQRPVFTAAARFFSNLVAATKLLKNRWTLYLCFSLRTQLDPGILFL